MARNKTLAVVFIVLLLALAAAVLILLNPSSTTVPDTVPADPASQVTSGRIGLAQSADKVDLALTGSGEAAPQEGGIIVTLDIDPGWHVNANPASMEFLIPTVARVVADKQPLEISTEYPPGRVSDITLGETAIEVYDDGAAIRLVPGDEELALLKDASQVELKVQVQACNDEGVCLAPSDLSIPLGEAGAGAP